MPPDPNCPACREKRPHTDDEWKLHPGEGRGGSEWNIPIKPSETVKDKAEAKR